MWMRSFLLQLCLSTTRNCMRMRTPIVWQKLWIYLVRSVILNGLQKPQWSSSLIRKIYFRRSWRKRILMLLLKIMTDLLSTNLPPDSCAINSLAKTKTRWNLSTTTVPVLLTPPTLLSCSILLSRSCSTRIWKTLVLVSQQDSGSHQDCHRLPLFNFWSLNFPYSVH